MKLNRLLTRLTLSAGLASLSSNAMEIIAHRGASFDAPENTLAAMNLAWKQKADAVELDIHLTKDGRVIVIHDFDTKRVGAVTNKVVE
ncbi:MAG: glycerophosphodiester phosphodiesterase, partial [Opitutaceae bacterium]|nr:glycerophosphodiester phosphodiesterase [Verrucomicrobiales bacterium]